MPEAHSEETAHANRVGHATPSQGPTTPSPPSAAQLRGAELRRIHAGRWVAWMPDKCDVAFVADTREEAQQKFRSARIQGLVLEAVPPARWR
jgi:hypothetical protein